MDYTFWLQTLMELALVAGGKKDKDILYRDVATTFMRKLDCTLFAVLDQQKGIDYVMPKNGQVKLQSMLATKACGFPESGYSCIAANDQVCYIYVLDDNGYLLMLRRQELPKGFDKELVPIVAILSGNMSGAKAFKSLQETKEALNKERAFLRQLIDTIPDMIFYKSQEGAYKLVNEATRQRLQMPDDKIIGKSDHMIHTPSAAQFFLRKDEEAKASAGAITYESTFEKTDGEFATTETSLTVFKDDSGRPDGILGISRDISPRKRIEALIQKRMAFQEILMHLALSFINIDIADLDNGIQKALASAGEFVGADRAYLFKYDFESNLMHNTHEWCPEGIEPVIDTLQNIPLAPVWKGWVDKHLAGLPIVIDDIESVRDIENIYSDLKLQAIQSLITLPLKHKDQVLGFIGFDAVLKPKKWTDDEAALLKLMAEMFTNALLRQVHESELVKEKLRAQEASEIKGRFLANMSHEIRTPLNGIVGMMFLLKDTPLNDEQREYARIVDYSIDALMEIINNILDFSKVESGELRLNLEPFDLQSEIKKVCGMLSGKALEKNLEVVVDYEPGLTTHFVGDSVRIRQILLNLLGNAIKFTEKGSIHIGVSAGVGPSNALSSEIAISVRDTGIGIKASALEAIFEHFTQEDDSTTKKYGGTGLGLAITKQLTLLMGGTVRVESSVGEGSCFTVILPLSVDECL